MEGDIEDKEGVLRITKIRITYRFYAPPGTKDKAERALAVYSELCPAYQTVKDCIDISWQAEVKES